MTDTPDIRKALADLLAHAERANQIMLDEAGIGVCDLSAIEAARAALAAPGQAPQPIGHVEIIDALAFIAVREGCDIDDGQPLYAGASPQAAVPAVTDEMIAAYLKANDAYWQAMDQLLPAPGRWRAGTVNDATRVSLQAAFAARPQAQPTPTDTPN